MFPSEYRQPRTNRIESILSTMTHCSVLMIIAGSKSFYLWTNDRQRKTEMPTVRGCYTAYILGTNSTGALIHSLIHSLAHPFTHSFIHPFILSPIHSFIYWQIHSLIIHSTFLKCLVGSLNYEEARVQRDDKDGKKIVPALKWFLVKWGDIAMHTDYNTMEKKKKKTVTWKATNKVLWE